MENVMAEIKGAMGNYHFVILFLASLMLSFFLLDKRRKVFLIPVTLMSIFILNPLFYDKWTEINDYAYWRTLWVVPIIPVCAVLPAAVIEKTRHSWLKLGSVAVSITVIILLGRFIYFHEYPEAPAYSSAYTTFSVATNADKLPEDVVSVGEALLELDDQPYVVADVSLSIYHRQFSGKIKAAYSRDIDYGGASTLAKNMNRMLVNGDFQALAQLMLNYDYEYLVTDNTNMERHQALEDADFELLRQINGYGIYRVHGKRNELRSYNDLHQVISVTLLDEQENPANGANGYATTEYGYDENGHIVYEFHRDVKGEGINDKSGRAGYKRKYDLWGCVTEEMYLDLNGDVTISGYYDIRKCEYNKNHKLIKESYFDVQGNPMLRTDALYSTRKLIYNNENHLIGERYYGLDGKLTVCSSGYAGYNRVLDDQGKVVMNSYIGIDEQPIMLSTGYAAYQRSYDESGNIVSERYLDNQGILVNRNTGYAEICRNYNEKRQLVQEMYLDKDGIPVILTNGYAGLSREYDDRGNIILEKYLDVDGNPVARKQGYAVVKRAYDERNNLTYEDYYDEQMKPVNIGESGYAGFFNEYSENGELILTHYYDKQGRIIDAGSAYLHEYLQSLIGKDVTVFIAARDEASSNLTSQLIEDLHLLGVQTDFRAKYRCSFYAVVHSAKAIEESGLEALEYNGEIAKVLFTIKSAGYLAGSYASIVINGQEYAKNVRGLNIVVMEDGEVTDSIAFDTHSQEMRVIR